MIFATALRGFLQRRPDALDLLEIEPQTLWLADDAYQGPFFEFTPGIELFASLPGHKLVHSVGVPLGGTKPPDPAQCALIRKTADRLDSPWVSEHLSVGGTPHQAAGFFLPPLQTDAGVATAIRNITAFRDAVGRPVAIETGVAYLARKSFEMPDGEFLARVAEGADCGILLDLHNLYCNQRNGRIRLDETLAQLPLDRVWEVHLAGGVEQDGFWLDSHSGPMPDDLKALAGEVLAHLPNLGALNFEIYDTFLERMPESALDDTVDALRTLWARVGKSSADARPSALPPTPARPAPSPALWEAALTEAVWKDGAANHPDSGDAPALRLYARLARSFRGSMLARTLPRAIRYLILRERERADPLLARYYGDVAAKLYAPLEAQAFCDWMAARDTDPLMQGLLAYDLALLRIVREGRPQIVHFPGNPGPVFEALAARRLPAMPDPPVWEMEILPDGFSITDFSGVAGPS